jgi:hypothetical protein
LNNPGRRFQQWRALQPWERRLLIKLFFLLPLTRLALNVAGFKRARRMAELDLPCDSTQIDPAAMARAQRYAQLTAIAARHGIHPATCLLQSLALCWLLRRRGLPAIIRIGVRPSAEPLQAHAWVELDEIPLGQPVDEYQTFPHFDSVMVPPDCDIRN